MLLSMTKEDELIDTESFSTAPQRQRLNVTDWTSDDVAMASRSTSIKVVLLKKRVFITIVGGKLPAGNTRLKVTLLK